MLFRDVARGNLKGQPKGLKLIRDLGMSFETGEQNTVKLYFPFAVTITKVRATVSKALAATDAGTITGANSTGNSTGGVVTVPASSAIGFEATAAVPTTNIVVPANDFYSFTSAKPTAGGKVHLQIEYTTN